MARDESVTADPHIDRDREFLELLTVEDIAALLKVSKSWVYEHTRSRNASRSEQLPHIKIGKYVRFAPHLVRAFIDRHASAPDRASERAARMARELQHGESTRGKGFSQ